MDLSVVEVIGLGIIGYLLAFLAPFIDDDINEELNREEDE